MSVAIEGGLQLILGPHPIVEIDRLRLQPPTHPEAVLHVRKARIGVAIWPLLKKRLRIVELAAKDMDLRWTTGKDAARPLEAEAKIVDRSREAPDISSSSSSSWRVEVVRIDIRDGNMTISREREDATHNLQISGIHGSSTEANGLHLSVSGVFRGIPWTAVIDGGSLDALVSRAVSWPLSITAKGAGAKLSVNGQLHPPPRSVALDFRLAGQPTSQMASLLGNAAAAVRDYDIAFHIEADNDRLRVSSVEGIIGATRVAGDGVWERLERRLSGSLTAEVLDLGPVLGLVNSNKSTESNASPPVSSVLPLREPPLSDWLATFEADFRIAVGSIVGLPGDIRDAAVHIVSTKKGIRIPMSMHVLGSSLQGAAVLSRAEKTTRFAVDLSVEEKDSRIVAGNASGGRNVVGRMDRLALSASAAGETLSDLLLDLEARLEVRNADLSATYGPEDRKVRLFLDSAEALLPAGGGLRATASGSILGEPFSVHVDAGGMADVLNEKRWPFETRLAGSGALLQVESDLETPGDTGGPDLSIHLSKDRIGRLAAWTGVPVSVGLPYRLEAGGFLGRDQWELEIRRFTVGDSTLRGTIAAKNPAKQPASVSVSIQADTLDVLQLKTLFPRRPAELGPVRSSGPSTAPGMVISRLLDMTILPKDVPLPEVRIDLGIRRLLADNLSYERCRIEAEIVKDRTTRSRFAFDLEDTAFSGEAFLEAYREEPLMGVRFSGRRLPLGEMLEEFGVVERVEVGVETADVVVSTRGRKLSDWIANREVSVDLRRAQLALPLSDFDKASVFVDHAKYTDKPGEPFLLDLEGSLGDSPLALHCTVDKRGPEKTSEKGQAYRLDGEIAGARLKLSGHLVFPLKRRGVVHRFSVSGDRLDRLEPLSKNFLPPVGPYEVTGAFEIRSEGYSLTDAAVSIGSSRLVGWLHLDTDGPRPRLEAALQAKTLQLEDFDWGESASAGAVPRRASREDEGERVPWTSALLDPRQDKGMDADISIEVNQVFAGDHTLGSGTLRFLRDENRVSISPISLSIPGGDVDSSLVLNRAEGRIHGTLEAGIKRLDFGPVLRLKNPKSRNSGTISLSVDLESTADTVEMLMEAADGRIAVSMQPENLRAGVLDFWATNLLLAVLPVINPRNESSINCIIADLVVDDGILKEKKILIDTSRIRVRGEARVDFRKQTVHLRLNPTPKRPQFLRLAKPIEVSGTFSDFKAGLAPGSLVGSVVRFLTAQVVVPFQWIVLNRLPEDGSDVCKDGFE